MNGRVSTNYFHNPDQQPSYLDKLLQMLVQARQIVLPPLVLGDQSLFFCNELLSLSLQFLSHSTFIVQPLLHHLVLILVGMVGVSL